MSQMSSDYVLMNAAARWRAVDFQFRVADRRNWFPNLPTLDVWSTKPISMQINKMDLKKIIILIIFFLHFNLFVYIYILFTAGRFA